MFNLKELFKFESYIEDVVKEFRLIEEEMNKELYSIRDVNFFIQINFDSGYIYFELCRENKMDKYNEYKLTLFKYKILETELHDNLYYYCKINDKINISYNNNKVEGYFIGEEIIKIENYKELKNIITEIFKKDNFIKMIEFWRNYPFISNEHILKN